MLNSQKKLTNIFYVLLSLPATAMGTALSIQIAALSWFMSEKYHLDIEQVGFVWAAGPLAGILGQVIVGLISDNVWFWGGRRRPFVLIGGTLAAAMLLALPNIDKISGFLGMGNIMIVALIVALTLDLSINISFNPTRSIIADVTPEGPSRTKGYTWMQTVSGFFGVAAYIIGAKWGNYILIYGGSIIVLLFSIIPMFYITEKKSFSAETKTTAKVEKTEAQWTELIKIYLAHGFSWIGIQTMFVFIFAFIQQKLNPESSDQIGTMIGIAFAVLNTVGFILPFFVLEPISEKLGRVKTHLLTLFIMSAGYFGIVFYTPNAYMLYIYMAIVGVGWAAVVSLPFAIMSEKVDKSRMGFFMGIFNLSVVIPQLIVSSVMGGIIKNAADKNIIFIISGVSLAISGALWLLVKETQHKNSKDFIPSSGH